MDKEDEFILKELDLFFKHNIKGEMEELNSGEIDEEDYPVVVGGDHSKLINLDYDSSGHTGFASQKELENYAEKEDLPESITESEIDKITES